jgi:ribosomal protein L11 methyltransferase
MRAVDVWRVGFVVAKAPPPELVQALEELAEAVSLFAHEMDDAHEALSWRIDLFFAGMPDAGALRARLQPLLAAHGLELGPFATTLLPEQDWVRQAAAQRGPVQVGRYYVHSAAERGRVPESAIGIEVEAGLAFGSGEHESTQGCLLALDWLAGRRSLRRVLDIGTGSGILAMAAAKTWPCRVVAVEIDRIAVEVARENAALNGVAARLAVHLGDAWRCAAVRRAAPYDLVLANILADPLIAMARDLRAGLRPGGFAVLSGLLDRQAPRVLEVHLAFGLHPVHRIDLGRWTTLVLRNRPRRGRSHRRP